MDKNDFLHSDPKKRAFHRSLDINGDMNKQRFFKMISKNVVFVDMLIFSEKWTFLYLDFSAFSK